MTEISKNTSKNEFPTDENERPIEQNQRPIGQKEQTIAENDCPIGIFDSGLGGLTVAKSIYDNLPNENLVYLGDNAHFPYGIKTLEEVCSYSIDICKWFEKTHDVKAIVIACNTATVASLKKVQNICSVPVFGVIEPVAQAAYKQTKNKNVGVLATEATIKSEIFTDVLKRIDSNVNVVGVAAPDLVLLAENETGKFVSDMNAVDSKFLPGIINDKNIDLANKYCQPLINENVDSVVLGCTHFELLTPLLQECFGKEVSLVSAGKAVSKQVKSYLAKNDLLNSNTNLENRISFYNTGTNNAKLSNLVSVLFEIDKPDINNVSLD